jgi:type III secretory pathway component EscS
MKQTYKRRRKYRLSNVLTPFGMKLFIVCIALVLATFVTGMLLINFRVL